MRSHRECVGDVFDRDALRRDEHADDVELVLLAVPAVPIDPDARGLAEFALLAVMYGFHRIAELVAFARLDFDKGDGGVALGDEVDVAPAELEAAGEDGVAVFAEPALGDAFAEVAEALVVGGHRGGTVGSRREIGVTAVLRVVTRTFAIPLTRREATVKRSASLRW